MLSNPIRQFPLKNKDPSEVYFRADMTISRKVKKLTELTKLNSVYLHKQTDSVQKRKKPCRAANRVSYQRYVTDINNEKKKKHGPYVNGCISVALFSSAWPIETLQHPFIHCWAAVTTHTDGTALGAIQGSVYCWRTCKVQGPDCLQILPQAWTDVRFPAWIIVLPPPLYWG